MNHRTIADFWAYFNDLPISIQRVARKNFSLLKHNPRHPSLHFKCVVREPSELWAVRAGIGYRALGRRRNQTIYWFWIGPHSEYDRLIS